jgi:hypothetical protein
MKPSTQIARAALAAWLERGEGAVTALLARSVLLRCATHSAVAETLKQQTYELLERTIEHLDLSDNASSPPNVEVLIGNVAERYPDARHVYVVWTEHEIVISHSSLVSQMDVPLHPILPRLAACYIAAAAVNALLDYPFSPAARPVRLDVADVLGSDATWATQMTDFGESVLAGAGAVGNGFLTALKCFPVRGRLHVADPKAVKDSVLPRCLWFDDGDLDQPKAEVLARKATPYFPELSIVPWKGTVSELRVQLRDSKIQRLIVGVDSRRARRRLQSELPREVFDASTTGIAEVVLHCNNAQDATACMACIYKEDVGERQHEEHVAEALGVSVDAVRREFVTHSDAVAIVKRNPGLEVGILVGRAFDSLFRERCATGTLPSVADRQVLAPLPFVSVLAGAWLAVETTRRLSGAARSDDYNYWRLSPWHSPNMTLKQGRPRDPMCECCGNAAVREAMGILWS